MLVGIFFFLLGVCAYLARNRFSPGLSRWLDYPVSRLSAACPVGQIIECAVI
jgi:hypothetical protein